MKIENYLFSISKKEEEENHLFSSLSLSLSLSFLNAVKLIIFNET